MNRLVVALAVLGGAMAALGFGALFIGSAPVSPGAVLAVLTGRGATAPMDQVVVLSLRLPRIAAAILAGGALAVAGVGFQGLTRNSLAEPSVLGVSSGAAFGVVTAQVFGLRAGLAETLGLTAFAFAGAFVAGTAVYAIAARAGGLVVHTLILAGVIVGIFFSSAITVLISIVDFDRLGSVIHWLLGNLAPLPPLALGVFALVAVVGFCLVFGQSRQLNLIALGEEGALQLGVDAERVKRRIFGGAALLTAAVVAFVGPIGFVGLIVPHALRHARAVQTSGRCVATARRRLRRAGALRRFAPPQRQRARRPLSHGPPSREVRWGPRPRQHAGRRRRPSRSPRRASRAGTRARRDVRSPSRRSRPRRAPMLRARARARRATRPHGSCGPQHLDQRPARGGMLVHGDAAPVHRLERALVHDRVHRSRARRRASIQQQEPITDLGDHVEVVGYEHDAEADLAVEPAKEPHALGLIAQIEMRRRLVEHEQPRALRERARQHHALPLPAAQPVEALVPEVEHPGRRERLSRVDAILRRLEQPAGRVREPPHEDEILDRVREPLGQVLRYDRDLGRDRGARQRVERPAPEADLAGGRLHDPGQEADQRGLAGRVRADHAEELARLDGEREIADRERLPVRARRGVRECDAAKLDERRHGAIRPARERSR